MNSVWMQDLTSNDIEEYLRREATVIVPIGATETHGPHLPLGTDTFEAIDYAEGIARKAGVICSPPIWFGDSPHHMGRPGTISLRSKTVIALLEDVYRSLVTHGFRRIITFNGHRMANVPVIQIASREVKHEHPDILFACFDPVFIAAETHMRLRSAPRDADHGGEFETSHMLFKRPELVHPDRFERVHGRYIDSPMVPIEMFAGGDKVFWTTTWRDQIAVTPKGHHGDPRAATKEKGEALFNAIVENGVRFIDSMRQFKGATTGLEGER